ncbi:hypothetical protein [Gordonia sputi]
MTEEDERLQAAVTTGRKRLLNKGVVKRQELRRALRTKADLAELVADVLVEAGIARKEPTMHGSWRLVLAGTAEKPDETVGPVANPVAGVYHGYGDTVGVLYRLTDELLHARGDGNGVADYDRAFTHTRAALARLSELQQRDRDAVATATLQRLRAARGATA